MKQVIQNRGTGRIAVEDVPAPVATPGFVLVRSGASLISVGTERLTVEEASKSLISKAAGRPDLVKQVLAKVRKDGLANTFQAVRTKLDEPLALGYSAAGIVCAVGEGVAGIVPGDRVACAGAGYASHAEVISVPQNLCACLPETVDLEQGAFGTLGAIALQGVRLAQPTLGESVVVIGLGLLGQLSVQLLRANGCSVFGVDPDERRRDLAVKLGADACSDTDEAEASIKQWTRGFGADAVLITAGTTSNGPLELAGAACRSKGRVVVVGMVGMDVPRGPYFRKEISLQISMSYGPGRYDPEYEERGHDYPYGYVRWTEKRNMEAFLDLVARGSIDVGRLITHRFPVDDAEAAYRLISENGEPHLGVVLTYDLQKQTEGRIEFKTRERKSAARVSIGLVGAGGYARGMLLPLFKKQGVEFRSVMTASGLTARGVAKEFGFAAAASEFAEAVKDEATNLVVIASRHDTHAHYAVSALEAGKHVFVEKPLALNDEELGQVIAAASASGARLMAGFNRRFSSHAAEAMRSFAGRNFPLSILYRVSSGRVPNDHWIQDPRQGGRIIGEVCHFIDMMHFLTGSRAIRVHAESVSTGIKSVTAADSVFITLKFADGSNGTIAYLAEGNSALPKERIEIFGGQKTFVIDDFRRAVSYRDGKETAHDLKTQDKGQAELVRIVCETVLNDGPPPIALDDLAATTRATFRIMDSLRTGEPAPV